MRTLDVVLDLGEDGGHCSDEKGAVLIVHRIMFLFRTFFACRAELLCDVYVLRFSLMKMESRSQATHEEWVHHPPPLRRGLLCVRRHDRILAILVLFLLSALSIAL